MTSLGQVNSFTHLITSGLPDQQRWLIVLQSIGPPTRHLIRAGKSEAGRPADVVAVGKQDANRDHAAHLGQVRDVSVLQTDLGKVVQVTWREEERRDAAEWAAGQA